MKTIDLGEHSETDWGSLYLSARSWGIQPSEFWCMTLAEWFSEAEQRREKQPGDYAGNLTRADVQELQEIANMSDEEWERYNGTSTARN